MHVTCSYHAFVFGSEFLEQKLLECFKKAWQANFEITPIIIDRAGKKAKMMKKLLQCLNNNSNEKILPAYLKYEPYFTCDSDKNFVFFVLLILWNVSEIVYFKKIIISHILNCVWAIDMF